MKRINLPKKSIAALTTLMLFLNTGFAFADMKKDESVYVVLKNNGDVEKRIVSTWINSDEKLGKFKDVSNLKNITNVKGDEKPIINGSNVNWNVNKEDLYYKGDSKKQLPIDVDIKYQLNGKESTPKDMKGKSGNFKITVDLKNKEKRTCKIDGENKEMYVPFLTATEVLLQRDNFKNIKINSGELVDDGKNCSVTFTSFPGLKESIDVSNDIEKYLKLEDKLVIEGKTTKFEMPSIMIMATPQLPELKGIDENSTLSDLSQALDKLKKGGDELLNGSKKLLDGNNQLNSNFAKFDKGVKSLDKGSNDINNGISKLSKATPTLNQGAKSISSGLGQLNESQGKFSNGVDSFVGSTNKLYQAYSGIHSGIASANEGANALQSGLSNGAGGVDSLIASTGSIDKVAGNLNNIASTLDETNPEAAGQLRAMSGSLSQVSQGQRNGLSSLKSGMSSAVSGANSLSAGLGKLSSGSSSFYSNFNSLVDAGSTLSSSSKKLSQATSSLENGSQKLVAGTDELNKGANQLTAGGKTLVSGTKELNTNSSKLLKGTNDLAKGSNDLYKGVNKLKSEGLDKLYKEGNTKLSDIEGLLDVKDEIVRLSKEYNNFSGISKDMDGSVKFIMKINE